MLTIRKVNEWNALRDEVVECRTHVIFPDATGLIIIIIIIIT